MRKERLVTFTDAVLAIIMTILVLELPKPENATIEMIWNLKESFFAYMLSFFWLGALWFVFKYNSVEQQTLFQSGWFMFGILSQTLIIHMIRTSKIPFIESKSSKQLLLSTLSIVVITLIIAFSNIATIFDLSRLPYIYVLWIVALLVIYGILIQVYKKFYIKKNKEWL